jgi:hypothetical protein
VKRSRTPLLQMVEGGKYHNWKSDKIKCPSINSEGNPFGPLHLTLNGAPPFRRAMNLFELIGDFVDASLRARLIFVAAGRARNANGADYVFAGLDRQGTTCRDHVAKP